jgi:hypothetical protein
MGDVVTAMSCPLPATVDTVEADPTTTAGVVDNSATQHTPAPSPRSHTPGHD